MTSAKYTLMLGDCLERMKEMPDNSVDAVVTDPPYGLGKEPDALAMLRDWMETGHHDVKGKGFMGKTWDAFVPQPAQWREVFRVLKPGGHVLAFAGTRTQDLMTLGLRLAGFEIRDMVAWVYGSGFPKSLDVSKAIDKTLGGKRDKVKPKSVINHQRQLGNRRPYMDDPNHTTDSDIPATAAAAEWEGWGTALKPALEPITLARKPLEGTVAQNVLKWHTGALNIEECRVSTEDKLNGNGGAYAEDGSERHDGTENWRYKREGGAGDFQQPQGRWPANLIHDGSEEVLGLFPVTTSGNGGHPQTGNRSSGFQMASCGTKIGHGDSGSAARFFYCAKTSKTDRNEGCESLPDKAWAHEGACIPERDNRPFNPSKNNHPTVKPTELMRYLCRLITPPGGVILDPFMGSGSTGKAAQKEGFSFIGIERDESYFKIAQQRILGSYTPTQTHEDDFC